MIRGSFVGVSIQSLLVVVSAAIGSAPFNAQCSDAWSLVATSGPTPVGGASMVFDEARGVSVLFDLGETWTWDGVNWSLLATTGPSIRWEQAMSYDPVRQRVVLFGGTDSVSVFGDTWEWDGLAWTQVANGGPAPRHGHGMAFVTATSVRSTRLFGGLDQNGGLLGDTWDWNGSTWTHKLLASSPSARAYHAMASHFSRVCVFGGNIGLGNEDSGETWDSSSNWDMIQVCGVGEREQSVMVEDTLRHREVLFGGRGWTDFEGETWEIQIGWRLTSMTGPSGRRLAAMAYDSLRARTVLFGGITETGISGETWEYSPVAVPDSPTSIAVSEVRKGVSQITWSAGSTTGITCAIERDRWDGSAWSATSTAGLVGPGISRLLDLPGSGPFRYRVKASTCAGDSVWSPDVIVIPAAPGSPSGNLLASRTAVFTWADRSDFESSIEVQRQRSLSGSGGPWSGTTTVATLVPDTTGFSERPGIGYWRYRVRALNLGGASDWSSWLVIQVR